MKHTIYLTSGQTAEIESDGGSQERGESIIFEQYGNEVACFKKEHVAGIVNYPLRKYKARDYYPMTKISPGWME